MKVGDHLKFAAWLSGFYEVQQRLKDLLGFLTHQDRATDHPADCLGIVRRAATESTPSPMAASQAFVLRFI
jgi:hypothetical protein